MKRFFLLVFLFFPTATFAETFEIYGAIRNNGQQWLAIDDDKHSPLNIQSIIDKDDYLQIHYKQNARQVGFLIITPDETFVQQGIAAGASVGTSFSIIKFSKNGLPIKPSELTEKSGNFWLYGKMIK